MLLISRTTLCRHIHFELSSISRELNTIFGLQMMIQVVSFHLCAVQFTIELYDNIVLLKTHFTYSTAINIACTFLWTVRCIVDIIVFNYICAKVCIKVTF